MNLPGATKFESKTSNYKEAGKALTREAMKNIPSGCLICQKTDNLLFLLHISVKSTDTISVLICHECAKQQTVFELCETVQAKIQTPCTNH